jgi:hypothetical protein
MVASVAFLMPTRALGTSIVVARTDTAVFGAADSYRNANPNAPPICKIQPCGNRAFIAFVGHTHRRPGNGWEDEIDYFKLAKIVCREGGSIEAISDTFANRLMADVQRGTDYDRGPDEQWRSPFAEGYEISVNPIFGVENAIPVISTIHLIAHINKPITTLVEHCPGDCAAGDVSYIPLGIKTEVLVYLSSHPEMFTLVDRAGMSDRLGFLIGLEMAKFPTIVGGPIDFVRVSLSGAPEWISQKPECKEQQGTEPGPLPVPLPNPVEEK